MSHENTFLRELDERNSDNLITLQSHILAGQ